MINKLGASLFLNMAVPANVVDLFQEFRWIQMSKARVLVRVDFANYLSDQRVFKDYIAEALIVDLSEDCVLIWTLNRNILDQVKPKVFNLV